MKLGVEAVDRRGLGDVERLALRDAFGDVEHHDVAELLEADEMGERAADLAGADQRDLRTRHVGKFLRCYPMLKLRVALFWTRVKTEARVFADPTYMRQLCLGGRNKEGWQICH